MGLFSKSTPDKDFDVEAAQPPLVTATPIPVDYAAASLPTPAQAASNAKFAAAASAPPAPQQQQQQQPQQQQPPIPFLGRHPIAVDCAHCHSNHVLTRTSTYPSLETWAMCGLILLVFWPACWIPLVMDSAKRTDHLCSRCGVLVGQVKPLSDCCVKERG